MPLYRVQTIMPMFTNLPTDVCVNQFHFLATSEDLAATATSIAARLQTFWRDIYGTTQADRVNYIDWPNMVAKVFKLDDPTPRVPAIRNLGYTNAGTAVSTIPTEVACVLSFQAAPESGVRFQRLYNRVFIGGLPNVAFTGSAVDEFPRLSTAWTVKTNSAMSNLRVANTSGLQWVQVSGATGAPVVRTIVGGWTDNGPDTQRRRSVLASVRTTWVA